MRSITCTNNNGMLINFSDKLAPFLLLKAEGLYTVTNNINSVENSMIDGSTFIDSLMTKRNIVLYLADKDNHTKNRDILYKLFTKNSKGTLKYRDDDSEYIIDREIDYYVESISFDSEKRVRTAVISLICTDPYFYGTSDIIVDMANWIKDFEFIHEFKLEELGHYVTEQIKRIDINSTIDVPVTIYIYAKDRVVNPIIRHVEKEEFISFSNLNDPFVMNAGDELVITTGINNKNIYLNGNKSNNILSPDSIFFTLTSGLNTLYYQADEGLDLLQIKIVYREKYVGV